jgi:hypothetical protein
MTVWCPDLLACQPDSLTNSQEFLRGSVVAKNATVGSASKPGTDVNSSSLVSWCQWYPPPHRWQ